MSCKLLAVFVSGIIMFNLSARSPLTVITPTLLKYTSPAELKQLRDQYGIKRFFICGPDHAKVQLRGYPDIADFEGIGNTMLRCKKELADDSVELNWWCAPTLRSGLNAPYQHVVNFDGRESHLGLCAFDPGFQQDFAAKIARVVEIARPPIVLMEDDYTQHTHPGVVLGCFCKRHLAEFSRRAGRNYTREEVAKLFLEDRPETLPLRKIFAEVNRDSLVELSKVIRQAVDKVAPDTRIGLCECGGTDIDGFMTFDVARALAGKTRPLIRVTGTEYSSEDSGRRIPLRTAHLFFDAEQMPQDIEWVHESDTYPHTTYFMSPEYLETLMLKSLFLGADGSQFYALQYLDDAAEDTGYLDMYRKSQPRFQAIHALGKEIELAGCRVIHDPLSVSSKRLKNTGFFSGGGDYAWGCAMLARMGIPYSTRKGSPVLLLGNEAEVLSDEKLTEILSGAVLMDVKAAGICRDRGFASLIGVDVKPIEKYEICLEEFAAIPEFADIKGRFNYNNAYAPAGAESAQYAQLQLLPGAEALSYYLNPEGERILIASSRFVNAKGGRVAVLSYSLTHNQSSTVFSLRRRKMLLRTIEWLRRSELPATVVDCPNVSIMVRRLAGGNYLLAVTSLSGSERENITLQLSKELRNTAAFELDDSGVWQELAPIPADGKLLLPGGTRVLHTRFIQLKAK